MPHERTDTPKLKNTTTGRYLYVGDVPKFDGSEIEITISKINLTARVTAHVSQDKIDSYANQMFMRWKTINDAMMDPIFSLHPLVKLSDLAKDKPLSTQAWVKVAEQYSSHVLEKSGQNIYYSSRNADSYRSNQDEDNYKESISDAYFKYIFNTNLRPDDVINDNARLGSFLSPANSRRLFNHHLGKLFTNESEKPG